MSNRQVWMAVIAVIVPFHHVISKKHAGKFSGHTHKLDVPCMAEWLFYACMTVHMVCMYLFVLVFPHVLQVLLHMDM